MTRKKIAGILIWLTFLYHPAISQDGNPLQFLNNVSQSTQTNPAVLPTTEKLVVGLPILSGALVEWDGNFALDYIFSDGFAYSFDNFYLTLGEPGDAITTAKIPLLYVGLRKEKRAIDFSVSEKVIAATKFDHEFLKFIDRGLLEYYGVNENFGPIAFNAQHYREVAVGFSYEIWEGFNIGFRPKLLFGKFLYDIPELKINVSTKSELEELHLTPQGTYTISGPVEIDYNSERQSTTINPAPNHGDYFFKLKNLSPALDLGLTYKLNKQTEFSLSVIDLGFIGVKHKTFNVTYSGAITYPSENLYQSNNPDAPDYTEPKQALQELNDSIPFVLRAQKTEERIFKQLPLKLNIGIKQTLANKTTIGVSNQFTYYNNNSDNFLTGFIHKPTNTGIDIAATLSLYKLNKILPGLGISYTGRFIQYYLSTNNIFKLIQPSSAKNLNLSFGVNFLFATDQK